MQFAILENDRRSLELLRDHLLRSKGTLLAFLSDHMHKNSIYETRCELQSLDWSGDRTFTIISEPKIHNLRGVVNKHQEAEIIWNKERIDLESFISCFFENITYVFGFIYSTNGD